MVPGIAERERRVADAQRRDWLADVLVGPAKSVRGLARGPGSSHERGILALKCQHRLSLAPHDLQFAIDVALRKMTALIAQRAPAE